MTNASPANDTALPKDTPVTAEFAAALEFEPWDDPENGWCPPTNAQRNEIGKWLLPNVRAAWFMMFKTNAELVEMVEALERDEILIETMDRFLEAEETVNGLQQVLRAASGRVACACAIIELRDGKTVGGDDDQR
ncbi:exonuclease VII small subunit [Rhodoblastus acidophilus]|uniref:hypothetical protein n=1 Tax=Rhodoblastus acidophilus TaxID=1074 RepID=UPI00222431B3|nr:hypothetical protein [Rhodoblastus acidophilus]MCW2286810.1 exonuclease VII small subunit [Rhodoblastus acidophilus]MCW2335663.1 exonuclease VII small subunit [Rhodoblastus acidophilus]